MKNHWLNKKKKPQLNQMGLGLLGTDKVVFIRKWRYTIEFFEDGESVTPQNFIKPSARPVENLNKDSDSISITYFGVQDEDLKKLSNFLLKSAYREAGKTTAKLKLYDGFGYLLETWVLNDVFFNSINFEFTYDDFPDINCMIKYSDVEYINHMG